MEKGYYGIEDAADYPETPMSQSTIKMEKGYYQKITGVEIGTGFGVAIHNKNGKGLLPIAIVLLAVVGLSQSTIKMEKGYYVVVVLLALENVC